MFISDSQAGFLYLQPLDQDGVFINNAPARTVQSTDTTIDPPDSPWPDPETNPASVNSNFRMCFVKYFGSNTDKTNYGHAEYQLLFGDNLRQLIRRTGACPRYVILYSSNLPCIKPQNPIIGVDQYDKTTRYRVPRCTDLVIITRKRLAGICEDSKFYLYTDKETPSSLAKGNTAFTQGQKNGIQEKIQRLDFANNDIIWIHP